VRRIARLELDKINFRLGRSIQIVSRDGLCKGDLLPVILVVFSQPINQNPDMPMKPWPSTGGGPGLACRMTL
jgi:hypothetical protein